MAEKVVAVRLVALTNAYRASMQQAAASTASFQRAAGGSFARVGGGLTGLAGPAAAAGAAIAGTALILGKSANAAIEYEAAFTGVTKTLEASQSEFDDISDSLLNLSTETGMAATELAGIAETAGQLGVPAGDVAEFTEVMAMLGVATADLDAQQAATDIARFAEITGMSLGDVDKFASALVALGNNFAATEREIMTLAMRLAGAGDQFGLTEADILGLAAGMKQVGLHTEAGGTAMSRVMVEIVDAVQRGTEALPMFAEAAGMTSAEFVRMVENDPSEALLRFIEGLDRMGIEGGNVLGFLDDLGLSEVRVRDTLLRTAGGVESLREALEMAGVEIENVDALTEEFGKRMDTNAVKIDRFIAAWERWKIAMGEEPANVLGSTASWFADRLDSVMDNMWRFEGTWSGAEMPSPFGGGEADFGWGNARGGTGEGEHHSVQNFTEAWREYVDIAPYAQRASRGTADELFNLSSGAEEAGAEVETLSERLDRLVGVNLDAVGAELRFIESLSDLKEELEDGTLTLDKNTEEGRKNQEAILDAAEAALRHVAALERQKAPQHEVSAAMRDHVAALREVMEQANLTEQEIEDYLMLLGLIPGSITTTIELQLPDGMTMADLRQHLIGAGPSGSPAPSSTTNTTTNNFTVNSTGGSATPVQQLRRLAEQVT